jgi:hypothetical protein
LLFDGDADKISILIKTIKTRKIMLYSFFEMMAAPFLPAPKNNYYSQETYRPTKSEATRAIITQLNKVVRIAAQMEQDRNPNARVIIHTVEGGYAYDWSVERIENSEE